MSDAIDKYKKYMDEAHTPYCTDEQFIEYFGRVPKFRYDTLRYCWDYFLENNFKLVVNWELLEVLLMESRKDVMKTILNTGNQIILMYGTGVQGVLLV